MTIEKRRQVIINFLYVAIILGILILLARYALGVGMPFFHRASGLPSAQTGR